MKKFAYPFLAISLGLSLGACSEQVTETDTLEQEQTAEANQVKTAAWSYEGGTGPENWGELDTSYSACTNGQEQSPINVEFSKIPAGNTTANTAIHYQATPFSLANNGHTIQANTTAKDNTLVIDGKKYELAQFHFHTPSEHQFNGQHYDMELHLVHKDAEENLAVLGVMIQEGEKNEALSALWEALPSEKTHEDISIESPVPLQALLPKDQTSFQYNGSLTTPPCTEEVEWIVFEEPIQMSKEQIQDFQRIFPENHRPVQPLNERDVLQAE